MSAKRMKSLASSRTVPLALILERTNCLLLESPTIIKKLANGRRATWNAGAKSPYRDDPICASPVSEGSHDPLYQVVRQRFVISGQHVVIERNGHRDLAFRLP